MLEIHNTADRASHKRVELGPAFRQLNVMAKLSKLQPQPHCHTIISAQHRDHPGISQPLV
jgi:hypothetical protein